MFEDIYRNLLSKINEGSQCIMLTYLDLDTDRSGTVTEKTVLTDEQIKQRSFNIKDSIYGEIIASLDTGKSQIVPIGGKKAVLIEPFKPKPRLIIFGGGHIAKPLSEFAARVGFSVIVIDDRPSFANKARFPEAERVICESFEKSFKLIDFKKSDYIAIITRGHRYDGVVLREMLKYDFTYVGMIGSKRRVKVMKEEMLDEGFKKEKLDLLNSPIGLDISAVTPDEIAISIVSQLIGYKNKITFNSSFKSSVYPELDVEVAEEAAKKSDMPKTLFTILSSKGSVPRKPGAKMIAYLDGRTVGSIGGGCSEAGLISKARGIISENRRFLIETVDMTGEASESEGMACGGIMEVLIEGAY